MAGSHQTVRTLQFGAGMSSIKSLGLEQARVNLPSVVAQAHGGEMSLITRHGKPYAAIVPVSVAMAGRGRSKLLDLRGSGKGLWGDSVSQTIRALRDEWD